MLFTIIHKALFRPLNPGDGGCPSWSAVSRLLSGVGSFLAELWPLSCETVPRKLELLTRRVNSCCCGQSGRRWWRSSR